MESSPLAKVIVHRPLSGNFINHPNIKYIECKNTKTLGTSNGFDPEMLTGLEEITFDDKINSMYSLKNSHNLLKIKLESKYPPKSEGFSSNSYENAEVIVPRGSLSRYLDHDVWKKFRNLHEEGQSSIDDPNNGEFNVRFIGSNLFIEGVSTCSVITLDGFSLIPSEDKSFQLPKRGTYIILTDKGTRKIIF